MKIINLSDEKGWEFAFKLLCTYLETPLKSSKLFDSLPDTLSSGERRICQFLFLGVMRHKSLIQHSLDQLMRKRPRPELDAILKLGAVELLEADEETMPKVVHFYVNQTKKHCSESESKLTNAVMRRLTEVLKNPPEDLGVQYSHPGFLIARWIRAFGRGNVVKLLEFNQLPSRVYVHVVEDEHFSIENFPLKETEWNGFYMYTGSDFGALKPLLESGKAYIQDPATRFPVQMLKPAPEETILDLCSAPGGKAVQVARCLGEKGKLVAVDLPGARIETLNMNLERIEGLNYDIVEADVMELSPGVFEKKGLPAKYSGVILDAPCSNTGVLRRKPDAKWRLRSEAIEGVVKIQEKMLRKASKFVAEGGRLIYSTCSIEPEENKELVDAFLAENSSFKLGEWNMSYPWETGHDGGGCFVLKRI